MKKIKRNYSVEVEHLNGDTDTVSDSKVASSVLAEFNKGYTLHEGEKIVPFHAVNIVTSVAETTEESVVDSTCVKGCNSMDAPVIEGDMSTLEVGTGEEFDPLEGITAVDDNGNEVSVTVTVKE